MNEPFENETGYPVRGDNGAGCPASNDCVVQGGHGQRRSHPGVERVSDYPVRPHVLDRAEIQVAIVCGVFGDCPSATARPRSVR
jgi:hypothetical protein